MNQTRHPRLHWLLLLLLAALIAVPALAQPGPPEGPGRGAAKGLTKRQERAKKLRDKVLLERVGLDETKAQKVETIVRKHRKEQKQIRREMQSARKTLRQLLRSDSNDQQAYQKALATMVEGEKKITAMRERHFRELGQVLTPKEQARLLATLIKVRRHINQRRAERGRRNKPNRPPRKRPKVPPKGPARDKGVFEHR